MDLSPAWFGVYKLAKFAIYPLSWIVMAAMATLVIACLPVTPRRRRGSDGVPSARCYLFF